MITILLLLTSCKRTAALDYGEAERWNYVFADYTLEETIQLGDLIFKGRCTLVEPKTPKEGYTSYLFDVREVIRGKYEEHQLRLVIPRVKTEYGGRELEFGKDEYEVGKDYYLVVSGEVYLFDPYYRPVSFLLNLNITDKKYENFGYPIKLPEGLSMRSYLEQCYDAVPHETETADAGTDYADEFEEFCAESTWIIRGKAVRVPFGVAFVSTTVELIEVYKGDISKLEFRSGSKAFTVATLENTMEEGKEYIIGLRQSMSGPFYQISTRTAVKDVEPSLIARIKESN